MSFQEKIESSVAFSDLISAKLEFSDIYLCGFVLGIASQDSIEFALTPFLLKF